jgi:methionyl-tRNA synthetase
MAKSKMSKSRGNVIDPITSMEKWGVDGVRWYLMRAGGGLPVDSGKSYLPWKGEYEFHTERGICWCVDYSSDELAVAYRQTSDQIGNLLSRISSPRLLSKMKPWTPEDENVELDEVLSGLRGTYETRMDEIGITKACEAIMDLMGIVSQSHLFRLSWDW